MLLCYLHGLVAANLKELGTTILNLKGQAALANSWMDGRLAKDPKELYTFYTATTHKEFHELLCVLLEEFEKTLQKLMKICQKAVILSQGSAKFTKLINSTCLYGYALQQIVNGSAIKQHLQNIEYSLQDHHWAEMEQDMVDVEEVDADLDFLVNLLNDTTMLKQRLWESYFNWLKLILSHFNAVKNLTNYATNSHYKDISIKILILLPMPTTTPTISLLTLFQKHSHMLPADTVTDEGEDEDEVDVEAEVKDEDLDKEESEGRPNLLQSNMAIVKFLLSVQSSWPADVLRDIDDLRKWVEDIKMGTANGLDDLSFDKFLKHTELLVRHIKECRLPGWKECVTEMTANLAKLAMLDSVDINGDDNRGCKFKDIRDALGLLGVKALLFVEMVTDEQAKVCGTLHCEASLASLLVLLPGAFDDKYRRIISTFKVTYSIVF